SRRAGRSARAAAATAPGRTGVKLRRTDWAAIALLAVMVLLGLAAWPIAPERMPVHWNWAGHADRLGGRAEGLFGAPLTAVVMYLLLQVLPRLDPRRAHYDAFAEAYGAVRLLVVALFCALQVMRLLALSGWHVDTERIFTLVGGAALIG